MKKTQGKDAIRNIRKQIVTFLSMACVTLLGVTGLLQIRSIMTSLERSVDEYYAETRFRDVEIACAAGLSEKSLSQIQSLTPVSEAEGVIRLDMVMIPAGDPDAEYYDGPREKPEERYNVHVISRTERISIPVLVDGRLPEASNECALDEELSNRTGLKIGDWITVRGGSMADMYLEDNILLITGLIYHPNTVTAMRADSVLVARQAFKDPDRYTSILVMLDIPEDIRRNAISDDYLRCVNDKADALRQMMPDVTENRLEEIRETIEGNETLNYHLNEVDLTTSDLLEWIGSENPTWEDADPRIRNIQSDIEATLYEYGMTLESASATYREISGSSAVVLDRTMNESYEYVRNIHMTLSRIGFFMAPLFALVAGIVLFSSTAIMIHDQRYQVGAMKAIGFRNSTIRTKYLVFGVAAALVGCIAGTALCTVINVSILRQWEKQFSIGGIRSYIPFAEAAVIAALFLIGAAAVVYAACGSLLKCSAAGLMNGSEPKQKTLTRQAEKPRKRSIYSELILNNIRLEKPRVIAMIIVVAVSVMLIGIGITLRHNLDETFRTQTEDIVQYDLKVNIPSQEPPWWKETLEEIFKTYGCEYAEGYEGEALVVSSGGTFGTTVLCMERDLILSFFNVGVPENSGIAISNNLADAYSIRTGDSVMMYSRMLTLKETHVTGTFPYHIGNLLVITADEYISLYGNQCSANRYFVKCSPEKMPDLLADIRQFNADYYDQVTLEIEKDAAEQFYPIRSLYDVILAAIFALTALMNLIVMINLTNILIRRRMCDLILMRVNGFSMRQVRGYFFREMAYTVVPGIVLGVAAGIPFTLFMLHRISTMKITLTVSTVWYAWVIAAVFAAALAAIVSIVSFRKVEKTSMVSLPRQ